MNSKLEEFKNLVSQYDTVYIQPHDYADADAIATAYGLLKMIEHWNKTAIIIHYGYIDKPNLNLMIEMFNIPITNLSEVFSVPQTDLLVVVDAQYGEGNVTKVNAVNIACIDHHDTVGEFTNYKYKDIHPAIGACSSIITYYYKKEDIPITKDMASCLYFGMYMDTDNFGGKTSFLDIALRDELKVIYDESSVKILMNSSLNLKDTIQVAKAMERVEQFKEILFSYVDDCDSNLLGHISDLLVDIAGVNIVVVYSKKKNGYKLSVRSFHRYINARDIAQQLVRGIGDGGGHSHKAGAFISKGNFEKIYPDTSFDLYIKTGCINFYQMPALIVGKDKPFHEFEKHNFYITKKKMYTMRYIDLKDHFKSNEIITVETVEGVKKVSADHFVLIGIMGEVYPISRKTFMKGYKPIQIDDNCCDCDSYIDMIKGLIRSNDSVISISNDNIKNFSSCIREMVSEVYAMQLQAPLRVIMNNGCFTGKKGDYLVVKDDEDFYILKEEIFEAAYEIDDNKAQRLH